MADDVIELTPAPGRDRGTDLGGRRWAGIVPRTGNQVLGAGLVSLGVLVGLFGAVVMFGESLRKVRSPLGWKIVLGGGAGVAGGVLLRGRRNYYELAAFERGMVYNKGRGARTVRWPEVTAVTEVRVDVIAVTNDYQTPDKQIGRTHTLRLQTKDGGDHWFNLGAVEQSEQLTAAVHAGTLPYLVPRAAEKLDEGRPVSFGPLALHPDGLVRGRYELAWADMGEVGIVNGVLIVTARGDRRPWAEEPCGGIPNVQVLLNLIKARARAAAPPPAQGDRGRPGASRYSVLDQYQQSADAPRIGY